MTTQTLDQYVVNAFELGPFTGNPAAVVPLEDWPDDRVLQAIASQNNLSETAFYVDGAEISLRWFTPSAEIDLCGHATLATAHVLLDELGDVRDELTFSTLGGQLTVARADTGYAMDFPGPAREIDEAPLGVAINLRSSVGAPEGEVLVCGDNCVLVLDNEKQVEDLVADASTVQMLPHGMLIATAPGAGEYDICSRVFAPAVGIPEDPVTGSAHCILAPYWAERLGKTELLARQASARGGRLTCRWKQGENRVILTGSCQTFLRGKINF